MPRPRRLRPIRPLAVLLALALAAWLAQQLGVEGIDGIGDWIRQDGPESTVGGPVSPDTAVDDAAGRDRIARAFAAGESGFMVTVAGKVVKLLSDDRDGSRHQRFLLRIDAGPTLLVAHNIDLAGRVPLDPGDRLLLRGQYEWNDRGGVLHWTHRDPDGDHAGGWIEVDGRRID